MGIEREIEGSVFFEGEFIEVWPTMWEHDKKIIPAYQVKDLEWRNGCGPKGGATYRVTYEK